MSAWQQPPVRQAFVSRRVMNLAQMLTHNAHRFAERPALIWGARQWNWAQMERRVSALAQVLRHAGVRSGQAVLVHSKNSHQMFESMLATFRLGAVWVPTNFRLLPADVVQMAELARPQVFLCQGDFPEHASAVQRACPGLPLLWLDGASPQPGQHAEALVQAQLGCHVPNAPVQWDAPCWLFFTSGTTGKPKASVLTHGQMGFVLTNHLCDLMPALGPQDGSLVVAPLSHGAGVHQLNVLARGAVSVLLPGERLDAEAAFALIAQHRLSNLFTVPTILNALVQHPAAGKHDHSSLRYVIYAGAPMYRADQIRAQQVLGDVLVQYYGLGEVTGCITVLPPHEHSMEANWPRTGTCGRARTGMQISIQDDSGQELPPGQTGEVCAIGPAVFAGYYDNAKANAESFRDGWFRTGDLGHMDAAGYLYLSGRASDMYISGGSNIHPRDIEEKLLLHPAVLEAAVLGVPDAKWGEVGLAVCALRPGHTAGEAELLDWLQDKVARYKLPRRIFFLDELPKSGYGKVPKALLRRALRERGILDADGRLP